MQRRSQKIIVNIILTLWRYVKRDPESVYATQELNDIQTGKANLMKFVVKTGKKYYKIVQQEFETWSGVSIMVNIVMEVFTHLLIKKLAKFTNLHHGWDPC